MRIQVFKERLDLLEYALVKTTQRLNLFEKVLIPQTQNHIKKIKIFLSDQERASVIQAKIAKAKTLERRDADQGALQEAA